jgi:hypothetical protein
MPAPRLHFGLPTLQGALAGYVKSFDLLELRCDPAPPTGKYLGRLRREAPPDFNFALVVGRALGDLASSALDSALVDATRRAAETLSARWLVVRTPASAAPSSRTRRRLADLVAALRGAATAIAWEPRGPWTDEEVVALSAELEVALVRDLAEQDAPRAPVLDTRLLALGRNSRLGSGAIERVTERLDGVEEAFIMIEGEGGAGVAKRIRASVGEVAAEADAAALEGAEEPDDEGDEGDGGEDESEDESEQDEDDDDGLDADLDADDESEDE